MGIFFWALISNNMVVCFFFLKISGKLGGPCCVPLVTSTVYPTKGSFRFDQTALFLATACHRF